MLPQSRPLDPPDPLLVRQVVARLLAVADDVAAVGRDVAGSRGATGLRGPAGAALDQLVGSAAASVDRVAAAVHEAAATLSRR